MSLSNNKNGKQKQHSEQADSIESVRQYYNWPLIIQREFISRIQQRSFKIVTLILILVVVIGATFPTILTILNSKAQTQIAITNNAGPVADFNDQTLLKYVDNYLNATSHTDTPPFLVSLAAPSGSAASHQQVRDKKIAILLTITRTPSKDLSFDFYTMEILVNATTPFQLLPGKIIGVGLVGITQLGIVTAYIPFLTPMMMLAREGIAPLAWWEVILSIGVMVISIFVCTWIAARIYRVGILLYGQKPGFSAYFQYLRSRPKGAA